MRPIRFIVLKEHEVSGKFMYLKSENARKCLHAETLETLVEMIKKELNLSATPADQLPPINVEFQNHAGFLMYRSLGGKDLHSFWKAWFMR